MSIPLVELHDVVVERNRVRILDIDRLVIEQSENVVIYGPNGSGKSTLLKLLMKFFYPSAIDGRQGIVRLFGQQTWNVWDLRTKLGFVSSEIDHHFTIGRSGRMTPFEAVLTGFESSELELEPSSITCEMKQQATQWLEFFEISPGCSKHVAWLSTGERRRVMLARALVLGARSLLLDEPTAGLDLLARERLLEKLEGMIKQSMQIVLITHHLDEVLPQFTRCVMLAQGRIFLDGQASMCLTSERISQLFGCPISVIRNDKRFTARLG